MNPLEQLRDIHLGEEISQWPPAYGWWILTALVLVMLGWLVLYLVRQRRQSLAKRQALVQLEKINADQLDWPQQVNSLLKRLAISYVQQHSVATLHTSRWVEFLSSQLPVKKRDTFVPVIEALQSSLYQKNAHQLNFEDVILQTKIWIRHVRPSKLMVTGMEVVDV